MSVVVCGVDDSSVGARSAAIAERIAAGLGTRLMLVHATPPPYVSSARPDKHEEARRQAAFERAGHMQTVLAPIAIEAPVRVERIVEFGPPADVLRSVATRERAKLVVVGFRGMTAVEEAMLGSTSSALAQECPCPVVLTPNVGDGRAPDFPGTAVVCGVDGSETAVAAAAAGGELADGFEVPLVVVHVAAAEDDEHERTVEAAREAVRTRAPSARVEGERRRGRAAEELVNAAREHGAGLVAVGSRGRGPVVGAVLGSVSRRLVRLADRPIMVVSPRALESAVSA